MPTEIKGFIGPSYRSISEAINGQRSINLRLEIDQSNGKVPLSLIGLPGYSMPVFTLPGGPLRGFHLTLGRLFAAAGRFLYEVMADWTFVQRGDFGDDSGLPVVMADNGLQLIAVSPPTSLIALDLATNEVVTGISNFPVGSNSVANIDNTMIAIDPDSQRFQISAVGNALSWNPLDFASAEVLPDNLVRLIAFNRQLYLLGTDSFQVFWNSGDATRPFIPLEGALGEIGCVAPYSVATDKTGVYWLGADRNGGASIYKAAGGTVGTVGTVSDPAIDHTLAGYTLADAEAYTFRMGAHSYYVITFPTDKQTWLFDTTTQGWSEYLEWVNGLRWDRHRSRCAIYAFGKQLIGDFETGDVYELREDIHSNAGNVQRAVRVSAHVSDNESKFPLAGVQVVAEMPLGSETGDEPQIMLRVRRDGRWTPLMNRSLGRIGEVNRRATWRRPCGAGRDYLLEVSITDPVPRVVVKALVGAI
jgi:hypothetical protein